MNISKRKNRIYFIGGINGVGKSAILNKILETDNRFMVINGSQYFMQWLGIKNNDYKILQSLSNSFKNYELKKMMKYLIYDYSLGNKPLLISAHYLRIIEGEISNAIGNWISLMNGLFFINADPKIILERLENDFIVEKNHRNIFPHNVSKKEKIYLLHNYQIKTLKKIKTLSKKINIPLFIIKNNLSLEKASNQLINYLNNLEINIK